MVTPSHRACYLVTMIDVVAVATVVVPIVTVIVIGIDEPTVRPLGVLRSAWKKCVVGLYAAHTGLAVEGDRRRARVRQLSVQCRRDSAVRLSVGT